MVAAFDEMQGHDGAVRPAYGELARWLADLPPDVLDYRRREAELIFRRIGITFAVYGEADAQERPDPLAPPAFRNRAAFLSSRPRIGTRAGAAVRRRRFQFEDRGASPFKGSLTAGHELARALPNYRFSNVS